MKAGAESLRNLNAELTRKLDEYSLTLNRLWSVSRQISASWKDEQYGSFQGAMNKIKGCKEQVESGVIEIRKLVAEMISDAEEYKKKQL